MLCCSHSSCHDNNSTKNFMLDVWCHLEPNQLNWLSDNCDMAPPRVPHIFIAKSSSIILHYLSLKASCLGQLNPQKNVSTCQSQYEGSAHVQTDGTLENISREPLLRLISKGVCSQHLFGKLHTSAV